MTNKELADLLWIEVLKSLQELRESNKITEKALKKLKSDLEKRNNVKDGR